MKNTNKQVTADTGIQSGSSFSVIVEAGGAFQHNECTDMFAAERNCRTADFLNKLKPFLRTAEKSPLTDLREDTAGCRTEK